MDKVATSSRSHTGVLFGILLAVMGLAMTAGNLDLLGPYRPTLVDFVPLALLLVALDRLLAGRPAKALWMMVAAIVVAWIRFSPDFRLRDLADGAPVLLVALGAWLV